MNDDNVFNLVPKGPEEEKLPQNDYCLTNLQDEDYFAHGFLIFTTHHVAVMRDDGKGAIPVLIMPLSNFRVAEIVEESEEDLPF